MANLPLNFLDYEFNLTDDYTPPIIDINIVPPKIQTFQIVALVLYSLVVLLGVPGNALVIWVTGFCMSRSVNSVWFLNLALADLLCCLSVPLLMVPLAHDDHWHFGALACTLVKGLFFLVMYCSILQLVLISVDRWLLVSRPVWCQNNRRPKMAILSCAAVWCVALIVSIPQFIYATHIEVGIKRECAIGIPREYAWVFMIFRFLVGFFLPFVVIAFCHVVVYMKTSGGLNRGRSRSNRTLRVIVAVVLSFFLCWLPLHIMNFHSLVIRRSAANSPQHYLAEIMVVSVAYFNSCLNPLLYVCLGRGFKDSMNRSLRSMLHFISEEPAVRNTVTTTESKSTSVVKEMTRI